MDKIQSNKRRNREHALPILSQSKSCETPWIIDNNSILSSSLQSVGVNQTNAA